MPLSALLLFCLSLGSGSFASHLQGGIMTFTPKGRNPDGSFRVDFRYKESFRNGCHQEFYWPCGLGDCGRKVHFEYNKIDEDPLGNGWCQAEGFMTRNIPSDQPFELREFSCCWIYDSVDTAPWQLLTHVDLGTRSDTSQPNRSPVTTITPIIRIPQNCPVSYRLLAHDPDGDSVRCRYGLRENAECHSCSRHPDLYLDENTCTLSYTYSSKRIHRFEIIMQDFPRQYIRLSYEDGTSSARSPLPQHRQGHNPTHYSTMSTPPATQPSSPATSTNNWWWWSSPAMPSNPPTTTPSWFWWNSSPITTAPLTTTTPYPNTSTSWWWWWQQTSAPNTTSTAAPTNTTGMVGTQYTASTASPTIRDRDGSPLSKIPLQFVVQVDDPVPDCTFGQYRPEFLSPTPDNGDLLSVSVGQEFQFTVRAQAVQSMVYDIKISGPLNITKSFIYISYSQEGQAVFSWTPTENDLNEHVPFCFVAETTDGYQSELRCVVAVVGRNHYGGEADVECTENTMTVSVLKSSMKGLHENYLRLIDPSCTLTSNSTHVIAAVSLNACGTQLVETEDNLIFRNEIISFDHPGQEVITRKHLVEIGFSCSYPKKGNVSLEFVAHRLPYVFTESGFGKFTYQFEFFSTDRYTRMIDPSAYPVTVELRDMLYIDIEATSSIPNTQLFVESCRATPHDDPSDPLFYDIIRNGCVEDDTVVVYPSSQTQYRFGMEAFAFIGQFSEVYISCTVILCQAGNPFTRCAQGCSTGVTAGHHRHRRQLSAETGRHFISQGPLRLARSSGSAVSSVNLNLNVVFIAGTFLVAVALVCGVLIYRNKATKIKYATLPSKDF